MNEKQTNSLYKVRGTFIKLLIQQNLATHRDQRDKQNMNVLTMNNPRNLFRGLHWGEYFEIFHWGRGVGKDPKSTQKHRIGNRYPESFLKERGMRPRGPPAHCTHQRKRIFGERTARGEKMTLCFLQNRVYICL